MNSGPEPQRGTDVEFDDPLKNRKEAKIHEKSVSDKSI